MKLREVRRFISKVHLLTVVFSFSFFLFLKKKSWSRDSPSVSLHVVEYYISIRAVGESEWINLNKKIIWEMKPNFFLYTCRVPRFFCVKFKKIKITRGKGKKNNPHCTYNPGVYLISITCRKCFWKRARQIQNLIAYTYKSCRRAHSSRQVKPSQKKRNWAVNKLQMILLEI